MALVSVTRLHVRSKRYTLPFFLYTFRSALQLRRSAGFRAGALGGDAEKGNWTVTVWESEGDMRAFRNSGPHRAAMKKLLDWCDEASYTHFLSDEAAVPQPEAAYARLRDGTISKVHHPSAAQTAGRTVSASVPRFTLPLRPARSA